VCTSSESAGIKNRPKNNTIVDNENNKDNALPRQHKKLKDN